MDLILKNSHAKEMKKTSDLYSAQFEYKDLVKRLSDLQGKRNRKAIKCIFKSFDEKKIQPKRNLRPRSEKRRTSNSELYHHDKKYEDRSSLAKRNYPRITGYRHNKNATEMLLNSELIPLYTPGMNQLSNLSVRKTLS